jgi:hypothetical protein
MNRNQKSFTLWVRSRKGHSKVTVTDVVTVLTPYVLAALEHGAFMKPRDVSMTAIINTCI